MFRLAPFFTMVMVGLLALTAMHWTPRFAPDAFADDDGTRLNAFGSLPDEDGLNVKLLHARNTPVYEIGLFGNSRALPVTSDDVPLAHGAFFNFAVSGASIRTNVRFLERLAIVGKAPRIVFVQFDHPLAMHMPTGPWDTDPLARWRDGVEDLARAFVDPSIDRKAWLGLTDLAVIQEWERFTALFSIDRLRVALHYAWPATIAWPSRDQSYRADGSRPMEAPLPLQATRFVRDPALPLPNVDGLLARLATVARTAGIRVIVYESPLHPAARAHFAMHQPEHLARDREAFAAGCRRHDLECRIGLALPEASRAPYWESWEHPAGSVLGTWLGGVLAGKHADDQP